MILEEFEVCWLERSDQEGRKWSRGGKWPGRVVRGGAVRTWSRGRQVIKRDDSWEIWGFSGARQV